MPEEGSNTPTNTPAPEVQPPAAPPPTTPVAPVAERVVPEAYELKAPEGVVLDKAMLDAFTPILKDLKLTNEEAQKLSDFYLDARGKEAKSTEEQALALRGEWKEELEKDPEFGGAKFESSLREAEGVLSEFAPNDLQMFKETGVLDYPPMRRLLSRVGRAMAEDKFRPGGNTTPEVDPAMVMFPTMAKN